MFSKECLEKLENINQCMNCLCNDYDREEFDLKLKHQELMLPYLDERDKIISELSKKDNLHLITKHFQSFPSLFEILPSAQDEEGSEEEYFDCTMIKSIKLILLPKYRYQLTIELYPNRYVENSILEKVEDIDGTVISTTKIQYKQKVSSEIFSYFESNEINPQLLNDFSLFYLYIGLEENDVEE